MNDTQLLSEYKRLQEKVARIVSSVYGVVPQALADNYTTAKDAAIARGLIQDD